MSLFISHYRLLLGSPLSGSRTFQMSLFFEVHCRITCCTCSVEAYFNQGHGEKQQWKHSCSVEWLDLTTDCEARSPLTLLFYTACFLSHGTSTRSQMVHAGTGSGVLNGMAWHTFCLVRFVLKGNLENLPAPVCSQCRWDNCHVSASLIRNRPACVCVHVWVMHIIYRKDCFLACCNFPFLITGLKASKRLCIICDIFYFEQFYLSIRISCSSTALEMHQSCSQLADFQPRSFGQMFWRRPNGALLW